jgi:hypothetical protein
MEEKMVLLRRKIGNDELPEESVKAFPEVID